MLTNRIVNLRIPDDSNLLKMSSLPTREKQVAKKKRGVLLQGCNVGLPTYLRKRCSCRNIPFGA